MSDKYKLLRNNINKVISEISKPIFSEIYNTINSEIESLCDNGIISFENDYRLTGFALECRTKEIFRNMKFDIHKGREGFEDFIITPNSQFNSQQPIVLEVKSSRKPNISRDDLRQLDDWVFDLSGEETARKFGLGGGMDATSMITRGLISSKKHHPSPHKGVMIFNGPVSISFSSRQSTCFGANEEEFVKKRNFCIIPFALLMDIFKQYKLNNSININFWEKIHKTSGILNFSEQTT